MADPDAIVRKQIDEYIEKLNVLANNAASKILECRDIANSDLLTAKEQARDVIEKLDKAIKRHERQRLDISALADKAAVLQSRLDAVESILDDVQEKSEAIADMVGKVVQIKSNPTLKMTAAAVERDGRILCVWMDGASFVEASIPFRALETSTLGSAGEAVAPDIAPEDVPAKVARSKELHQQELQRLNKR